MSVIEGYMVVNLYKGIKKVPKALDEWIEGYFEGKLNSYVILYGPSGNGKTHCVKELAKKHQLDLLRYTADDFTDVNRVKKSLNLQSLSSQKKKLIVFDDIQDIKNKRQLYKMFSISNFPLVYIINRLANASEDFVANGIVYKVRRPMNFEMRKILEQRANELNIKCKNLYDISEQATSIRTALQSLLLDCVIVKEPTVKSNYSIIKLMYMRMLDTDISWFILRDAFRNIEQLNVKSYNLMCEFAFWDYVVHYEHFKNKRILLNKIFFNNMPNIDLVKPVWKERKNNKKAKKEVQKEVVIKEVEEVKQPSLGSFF